MFIGETLHFDSTTDNPMTYYSPWFSRGGNRGRMTCNVVAYGGSFDAFEVVVQTKNSEQSDKDAFTNPQWAQGITLGFNNDTEWLAGAPLSDGTNPGLLELVRFEYKFETEKSGAGWVHFRMLQPQWFTN